MDQPTGTVIRRYERSSPGELVHLDVKKVGKVPPGGGWRVHGRGSPKAKRKRRRRLGYTYLHVAVDDYSRVAYVEAHDNETADTLLGFWRRAQDWYVNGQWDLPSGGHVELPVGGQQNCPVVAGCSARSSVGQWRHPLAGGGLGEADAVAGGHDDVGVVQ